MSSTSETIKPWLEFGLWFTSYQLLYYCLNLTEFVLLFIFLWIGWSKYFGTVWFCNYDIEICYHDLCLIDFLLKKYLLVGYRMS